MPLEYSEGGDVQFQCTSMRFRRQTVAMLETMMTASRAMMAYSMGGSWFDPDVGASIRVELSSCSTDRVLPLMLMYFSPGMAVEIRASKPKT